MPECEVCGNEYDKRIEVTGVGEATIPTTTLPTWTIGRRQFTIRPGLRHGFRLSISGTKGNGKSSTRRGDHVEASSQETGHITGTKDKDYNVIWFTEQCLSNALRLEQYIQDAERDGDSELADFFRRAQGASRKGAEEGKDMLRSRLSGS